MSIIRPFTQHPSSVGETYLEHLGVAWRFGVRMMVAGVACTIHALLPFLFERTASDCVLRLHDKMVGRRNPASASPSSGAATPAVKS